MVKLHIVLARCSSSFEDARSGWYTEGLHRLEMNANSGHIFVYEACTCADDLMPSKRHRPTWGVTINCVPNIGYEAGIYLRHLLAMRQSGTAFADTTFFLPTTLEHHVDLSVCPFSCRKCHAIDSDEVLAQLRQRAIQYGYIGIGMSYRDDIMRSGDPCNKQVVRWMHHALFDATALQPPSNLAATMNAVFVLSNTSIYQAFNKRGSVIERAARLVGADINNNSSSNAPYDYSASTRRLSHLYEGACARHPDLAPPDEPEKAATLRSRRKLEAIGMEMLWHVLFGAGPVLPTCQAPCVTWWQMEV